MNLTYIRIELTRQARDVGNLMFALLLPVVMYLLFGNAMSVGDASAGNGNVKFYVMASMAAYGAAVATTQISGTAATESMLGWGRQISLTPMRSAGFVGSKVSVALIVSAASAGLVFLVGRATGAEADATWIWWASYGIAVAGSTIFAFFGMAAGLIFKSETAIGVASGLLVFFSFFGNVFMPLSGTMLDIARFTPMYGYAGLVRFPLTEGAAASDGAVADTLPMLLANVVVWTLIFASAAVLAVRRSRQRR